MRILLHPDSPVPLYRQVADGLSAAVQAGILRAGDAVPSARALAEELGVNYHTVARAWRELEELGVLQRQRGGAFLVSADARARGSFLSLEVQARALCRDALAAGMSAQAVLELVAACLAEASPAEVGPCSA